MILHPTVISQEIRTARVLQDFLTPISPKQMTAP